VSINIKSITVNQQMAGEVQVEFHFEGYLTIEQWDKVKQALGLESPNFRNRQIGVPWSKLEIEDRKQDVH
jgi:hypothetical protein